jgi:hypothetical protein
VEIRPWRSSTISAGWGGSARTDLVMAFVLDGSSAVEGKRVSGGHGAGVRVGMLMQAR